MNESNSQQMAVNKNTDIAIWEDETSLQEIKSVFAPALTDLEFKVFVGMGRATQLSPFLREIWAVKYDKSKPAQIFIGRDGYRKSAQRLPDYDYHHVDSIYSNDHFEVHNGVIDHKYQFANRGELLGAYCIVKRKDSSVPIQIMVSMKEYHKSQSTWNSMPETMIKKVAEAQGLRSAFQEVFAGTYGEFENVEQKQVSSRVEQFKQNLAKNVAEQSEPIDLEPHEINVSPITDELLDEITGLIAEKKFEHDRVMKALEYYEVDCLESLNISQAESFIRKLEKV